VQTIFGKPEKTSFDFAEKLIDAQSTNVQCIYMIGDNPLTDVKGANAAGGRWRSILTRTGMHIGRENHDTFTAHQVVDDVVGALDFMKRDFWG
jgi:ribonucleotide monophosphatase NagD (HAD superfamily)